MLQGAKGLLPRWEGVLSETGIGRTYLALKPDSRNTKTRLKRVLDILPPRMERQKAVLTTLWRQD